MALHQIPGWHTSALSPPDAMHLLYLGMMNWIVKQVLVAQECSTSGISAIATHKIFSTNVWTVYGCPETSSDYPQGL